MIGQLTGTIDYCLANPIIISVGGVGYEVSVTPKLFAGISHGSTITVFIHTHVREDTLELFGFPSREDLDMFHLLITVSGVGPKTALLVIDKGAQPIRNAIMKSDIDFFTTIPRLGKKNAQKIIIELKNKLGSITDLDLSGDASGDTAQIVEALMGMGFARSEITEAYKHIRFPEGCTLEERIKIVLRTLSKLK